MAHYRKIDVAIWNDPEFQKIWNRKFLKKISVPPSLRNPRAVFTGQQLVARSRRCEFKRLRSKLFSSVSEKFGAKCMNCGSDTKLILDHVIPICWGGTNDVANMQILCSSCNSSKGGILPTPPCEELEECNGR